MATTTEDKAKVFIFTDGSKESQVLEFESSKNPYIQITKLKVDKADPSNIESNYILKLPKSVLNSNDMTKIHLHFTQEDFAEHNITEQKHQLAAKYPNLAIFYAYELMSRDVAAMRCDAYYPNPKGEKTIMDKLDEQGIPAPEQKEFDEEAEPEHTKKETKKA